MHKSPQATPQKTTTMHAACLCGFEKDTEEIFGRTNFCCNGEGNYSVKALNGGFFTAEEFRHLRKLPMEPEGEVSEWKAIFTCGSRTLARAERGNYLVFRSWREEANMSRAIRSMAGGRPFKPLGRCIFGVRSRFLDGWKLELYVYDGLWGIKKTTQVNILPSFQYEQAVYCHFRRDDSLMLGFPKVENGRASALLVFILNMRSEPDRKSQRRVFLPDREVLDLKLKCFISVHFFGIIVVFKQTEGTTLAIRTYKKLDPEKCQYINNIPILGFDDEIVWSETCDELDVLCCAGRVVVSLNMTTGRNKVWRLTNPEAVLAIPPAPLKTTDKTAAVLVKIGSLPFIWVLFRNVQEGMKVQFYDEEGRGFAHIAEGIYLEGKTTGDEVVVRSQAGHLSLVYVHRVDIDSIIAKIKDQWAQSQ